MKQTTTRFILTDPSYEARYRALSSVHARLCEAIIKHAPEDVATQIFNDVDRVESVMEFKKVTEQSEHGAFVEVEISLN